MQIMAVTPFDKRRSKVLISEDFAFVSHEVPTVSMFLSAGNAKEGYLYGQHHPKVRFDDSVLYEGSAAYTYMALRWLADHQ